MTFQTQMKERSTMLYQHRDWARRQYCQINTVDSSSSCATGSHNLAVDCFSIASTRIVVRYQHTQLQPKPGSVDGDILWEVFSPETTFFAKVLCISASTHDSVYHTERKHCQTSDGKQTNENLSLKGACKYSHLTLFDSALRTKRIDVATLSTGVSWERVKQGIYQLNLVDRSVQEGSHQLNLVDRTVTTRLSSIRFSWWNGPWGSRRPSSINIRVNKAPQAKQRSTARLSSTKLSWWYGPPRLRSTKFRW